MSLICLTNRDKYGLIIDHRLIDGWEWAGWQQLSEMTDADKKKQKTNTSVIG